MVASFHRMNSTGSNGAVNAWLHRFPTASAPVARLFCFHHAGGNAMAFRLWQGALPEGLELAAIQLPGRSNRLREPPVDRVEPMVEAVAEAISNFQDLPYVFFGHSMGALLAFEVARAIASAGHNLPQQLFLSSHKPPHLPRPNRDIHQLDDDAFLAELDSRYGGVPAEILEHRDLLDLLLPALRADVTALETFVAADRTPIACPITALGGERDRSAGFEQLEAWRGYTTGAFVVRQFPGGHFYLNDFRDDIIAEVARALSPLIPASREAGHTVATRRLKMGHSLPRDSLKPGRAPTAV